MDDEDLAAAVSLAMFICRLYLILSSVAGKTCWIGQVRWFSGYDDASRNLIATSIQSSLGNTCYMNSTVQALRAIPELQVALGV